MGGAGSVREAAVPRGVLDDPRTVSFDLRRHLPAADLSWAVQHFWVVEWDRRGSPDGRGTVLPHPCVNVAVESGELAIHGVASAVFQRTLRGSGRVFGIRFRPGGFRPFAGRSVRHFTDCVVPARDGLPDVDELATGLVAAGSDEEQVELAQAWLRACAVPPDEVAVLVAEVTAALIGDPSIRRVSDSQEAFGLGERRMQRLFRGYVGVTPRWVLRRARLHAAAERVIELAVGDDPVGWADVAADLGYVDQAHFIRDFRTAIGETPARWAASLGGTRHH